MSREVDVRAQITDLNALHRAAKRLGGKLVLNKKTYQLWSVNDVCDHCIEFAGTPHEVGVIYDEQAQEYNLKFDADRGLGNIIGRQAEKLQDHYNIEKAYGEAVSAGMVATEMPMWEDGTMELEIKVMDYS